MTVNNSSLVCCWIIQCQKCGKKGHWIGDCPKLKK
ncbi:hypothetical protein EBR43_10670 [bacterium]|nr:hypothetical protein [bacterium]